MKCYVCIYRRITYVSLVLLMSEAEDEKVCVGCSRVITNLAHNGKLVAIIRLALKQLWVQVFTQKTPLCCTNQFSAGQFSR